MMFLQSSAVIKDCTSASIEFWSNVWWIYLPLDAAESTALVKLAALGYTLKPHNPTKTAPISESRSGITFDRIGVGERTRLLRHKMLARHNQRPQVPGAPNGTDHTNAFAHFRAAAAAHQLERCTTQWPLQRSGYRRTRHHDIWRLASRLEPWLCPANGAAAQSRIRLCPWYGLSRNTSSSMSRLPITCERKLSLATNSAARPQNSAATCLV